MTPWQEEMSHFKFLGRTPQRVHKILYQIFTESCRGSAPWTPRGKVGFGLESCSFLMRFCGFYGGMLEVTMKLLATGLSAAHGTGL